MASAEAASRYPYPPEEPASLRRQQLALGNLGVMLLDTYADVDDSALTLSSSWRSDTATKAVSDVTALAAAMYGDSGILSTAASAIGTYAGQVETARSAIDGIRRRYDAAVATRDQADASVPSDHDHPDEGPRQQHQADFDTSVSGLDAEHETALSTVQSQASPAVAELESALQRFVGTNPPTTGSLGEVAYQHSSLGLALTSDSPYEYDLREAGLLTGASPDGAYQLWLQRAAAEHISPDVLIQISRDHNITPGSFAVLDGMTATQDPDGKYYFSVPPRMNGDDAAAAVLMTYILNCGTDYAAAGAADKAAGHFGNDYPETPYSSAEVQRIGERMAANSWTYDNDVDYVNGNGGRLVTTPNGMLMGLGGNWLQDMYSAQGGSTWGDIFMLNIDGPQGDDAAATLQKVVASGSAWYAKDDGSTFQGSLDLDRLLHHEERHSEQWAVLGHDAYIAAYGGDSAWTWLVGGDNAFEKDAGLHDGGYGQ